MNTGAVNQAERDGRRRVQGRLVALVCSGVIAVEILMLLAPLPFAGRLWLRSAVLATPLPPSASAEARALDLSRFDMADALATLWRADRRPLAVTATDWPLPGASTTATLDAGDFTRALRQAAGHLALTALPFALLGGLALYAVLHLWLVRPLHGMVAGMAEIHRQTRAAQWRHARLAALAAAISRANHDLRGVLSPALLSAERLQNHADPAVKRGGDVLVRSVERAIDVMRRVAEQAREVPSLPDKSRLAVRDAVEAAAEQTRRACPTLAVENAVPEDIPVEADHDSLVRLLGNLLGNAGESGARRVRVSAEVTANELAIVVTDDGPGLPASIAASPFAPFAHSAGMGLAMARELARAHAGDVALLQTGAAGASFRVTFPAPRPAAFAPRRSASGTA